MKDAIKVVQDHFSAGRVAEAMEVATCSALPVQLKNIGDLLVWCRENAERTIGNEAKKSRVVHSYRVESGAVATSVLELDDAAPLVFMIRDAVVAAGHAMIGTQDGTVLPAVPLWGRTRKKGVLAKHTYGVIAARVGSDEILCERLPEATVIPEGIYASLVSKTFGIKVMMLAGLAMVRQALGDNRLPLVFQKKHRPQTFELAALRAIGYRDNEVVIVDNAPTTRVERLWVPYLPLTLYPRHIITCSGVTRALRERLSVGSRRGAGERIYISRRDADRRRVENEDEVIDLIRGYGFRVIEFTGLDVSARVDALRNAEIVLGPVGSNLFNAVFAPADCWVVEFMPHFYEVDPAIRDSIAHLVLSIGQKYVRVPCDVLQTEAKYTHWNLVAREEDLRVGLDFVARQL